MTHLQDVVAIQRKLILTANPGMHCRGTGPLKFQLVISLCEV